MAADNYLSAIRLNGTTVDISSVRSQETPGVTGFFKALMQYSTCRWDKDCIVTVETKPDDVLEFDVENEGGPGMFRCLIKRDGKTHKTGDVSFTTPAGATVVGAQAVWDSQMKANQKTNLADSKYIWQTDACQACKVTFSIKIPK